MAPDQENKQVASPLGSIDTAGFPIVYSNIASLTAGFNEIRIYLGEAFSKQVSVVAEPPELKPTDIAVAPRVCIVANPEFSRSLRDALSRTIDIYEKRFGKLRPEPTPPAPAP